LLPKNNEIKPYLEQNKFELDPEQIYDHNPFLLARRVLHAPRDRFYKFRILHGDIFCNTRMYKFKMVTSPNCKYCPNTQETVRHVLWDCPRAAQAWSYLKAYIRGKVDDGYITYNTIILGNPDPNMAIETMITWITKALLSIDRDLIGNDLIEKKFNTLYYYERTTFGLTSRKMKKRWGNLLNLFNTPG
jgi:hypothetical protein